MVFFTSDQVILQIKGALILPLYICDCGGIGRRCGLREYYVYQGFVMDLYSNYKIYGPYKNKKDNRLRVVLVNKSDPKDKKTISYPKFIIENHIGRKLLENETIDHIDNDPLNNSIDNLRIIDRKKHSFLDAKRIKEQSFECPVCNKSFILSGRKLSQALINIKKKKTSGPFCSKKCAGKYGSMIQNKKIDKINPINPEKNYYTYKNLSLYKEK